MSFKREVVTTLSFTCDGCKKEVKSTGNRPDGWAKFKLMLDKKWKQRTMDVCNECCYKIHTATGINLIPQKAE